MNAFADLIDIVVRILCGERMKKSTPAQWRVLWGTGLLFAVIFFLLGRADIFMSIASPLRLFFSAFGVGAVGLIILAIMADKLSTAVMATLGVAGWTATVVQLVMMHSGK